MRPFSFVSAAKGIRNNATASLLFVLDSRVISSALSRISIDNHHASYTLWVEDGGVGLRNDSRKINRPCRVESTRSERVRTKINSIDTSTSRRVASDVVYEYE